MQRVQATKELFAYMKKQQGVSFKRKDDIARMTRRRYDHHKGMIETK